MYIGICGPSGAGKDTAAELLVAQTGYVHVSGGDILREMLTALGLEPKKSALGPFGIFIRDNYGLEPLFQRVLQKAAGHNGVIVTGIRSLDEVKLIKSQGGKIIFIEADTKIRYERIIARSRSHDVKSLQEFIALEQQENSGVTGLQQNLGHIRSLADTVIVNDGSISDLKRKLAAITV